MGIGVSVFLITIGLILKFAIQPDAMTDPVDIHVIGVILIIVGGATFVLQMLMTARGRGPGSGSGPRRDERMYDGDNPPR
ncbi:MULTISPECIES: DUF6458 family protein [Actinomadura]|uniref:DUF6458 domain-containing protein n=1 Tax=Actinomadura bangladeshensis TaxID=453573 RepID=A0A4V2XJW7_9ACTN|nr:DUF6458 family protein [Actinomadura bangladeshensis]TDC04226.1 hypothetical protein E1284_37175 [Actinomadura bangladeshensis]